MPKLTSRLVKALPLPAKGRRIVWDTVLHGLGVRVTCKGAKNYVLNFKGDDGKYHRVNLGHADDLSAEKARAKAKKGLPQKERAEKRGLTFDEVAGKYMVFARAEGHRSAPEAERIIRHDLSPALGKKAAADVGVKDVLAVVDSIRERGATVLANRAGSLMKRIYFWGMSRELVPANPAARLRPFRERPRERSLSPEEIRAFWNGLEKIAGGKRTIAALKLILVTGARPGEITAMRAEDIDEENWYTVPEQVSKSGHRHRVYLSPLAMSILHEIGIPETGRVFDFQRHALSRLLHREHGKLKIKERFCPHDLRRSAASGMASAGIPRFVVARILGHADREVTGVYDRYTYDSEKRDAAIKWAARLEEIITGKKAKVIPIAR